jgi:hypothetical protein
MTDTPEQDLTPGQRRMAKAHAAWRRQAEEKHAALLRDRGWVCVPPELIVFHGDSDLPRPDDQRPAKWLIYDLPAGDWSAA